MTISRKPLVANTGDTAEVRDADAVAATATVRVTGTGTVRVTDMAAVRETSGADAKSVVGSVPGSESATTRNQRPKRRRWRTRSPG
jgi:hypothetical protein